MTTRIIQPCCPQAISAYPEPCPAHGQPYPDIVVTDGPLVLVDHQDEDET